MIKKWEVLKAQDVKNANKHQLLLKCELKDILKIVKKLGAVCSRPERIISKDYNFIVYLFDYNKEIDLKLKNTIEEISSGKTTQVATVEKKSETAASVQEEISIPVPDLEIKKEEKIEIPVPKIEKKEEVKEPKKDEKEISDRKKTFGPVVPKSQSMRMAREEIKKEEEKEKVEEAKKLEENKGELSRRSLEKIRLKWSIELPLNPMLSFQTLITGSHNRFAHAAAMAVVENPGVMYNPILIYGPVGNGKSHFIHSMSYGLSSTIGQKNIFVTNGVKFSIGVNLAIKEGFIDSLEKIINDCKVIIIDDIHLMLINKENKQFISKVISGSMQSNKQVVFSSLFSPQELEPLENMLGIQFSQGWMVDIKQPNPQTYRLILNQILSNMDIKLSEEHIKNFFINKSMDFKTVNKTLFRMKKLEKYLSPINQSLLHQDMISMLLGDKDDFSMPSEGEIKGANVYSSQSEDSFYKWGFFCPKGMKEYVNYMGAKLKETSSQKLSMEIEWKNVFVEEYDPDEIYGIPFKIGNYVLDKNINGLIVMGPPPTSALSSKEQEFSHLTEKILESMNIKTAWIYSNKLKAESVYLAAILDLI